MIWWYWVAFAILLAVGSLLMYVAVSVLSIVIERLFYAIKEKINDRDSRRAR